MPALGVDDRDSVSLLPRSREIVGRLRPSLFQESAPSEAADFKVGGCQGALRMRELGVGRLTTYTFVL